MTKHASYTCLRCRDITCVSIDVMREHVETAHAIALDCVTWRRGDTLCNANGAIVEWYGHVGYDVPFLCLEYSEQAEQLGPIDKQRLIDVHLARIESRLAALEDSRVRANENAVHRLSESRLIEAQQNAENVRQMRNEMQMRFDDSDKRLDAIEQRLTTLEQRYADAT